MQRRFENMCNALDRWSEKADGRVGEWEKSLDDRVRGWERRLETWEKKDGEGGSGDNHGEGEKDGLIQHRGKRGGESDSVEEKK